MIALPEDRFQSLLQIAFHRLGPAHDSFTATRGSLSATP
jgi:hypothetical protein